MSIVEHDRHTSLPLYEHTFPKLPTKPQIIAIGRQQTFPKKTTLLHYPIYLIDKPLFHKSRTLRLTHCIGYVVGNVTDALRFTDEHGHPLLQSPLVHIQLYTDAYQRMTAEDEQEEQDNDQSDFHREHQMKKQKPSVRGGDGVRATTEWKDHVKSIPFVKCNDPSFALADDFSRQQPEYIWKFPRDVESHFFLKWLSQQSLDKERHAYSVYRVSADRPAYTFWFCLMVALQSIGVYLNVSQCIQYCKEQRRPPSSASASASSPQVLAQIESILQIKCLLIVECPQRVGIIMRTSTSSSSTTPTTTTTLPPWKGFVLLAVQPETHEYSVIAHRGHLLFEHVRQFPKDILALLRRDCAQDLSLCRNRDVAEYLYKHIAKEEAVATALDAHHSPFVLRYHQQGGFREQMDEQRRRYGILPTMTFHPVLQIVEEDVMDEHIRRGAPGTLPTEQVSSFEKPALDAILRVHDHWRHQLHDDARCEPAFFLEGMFWRTVTHYLLFTQWKTKDVSFAYSLCVPADIATAQVPHQFAHEQQSQKRKRRRYIPDILFENCVFACNIAMRKDPRYHKWLTAASAGDAAAAAAAAAATPTRLMMEYEQARKKALFAKFNQHLERKNLLQKTQHACLILPNQQPDWLLMFVRQQLGHYATNTTVASSF